MAQAPRQRRKATQSAEDAIKDALEKGEEPRFTTDEGGQELAQRPISLKLGEKSPKAAPGKRVRVYHKRNATVFLSNGEKLGPNAEQDILLEDYERVKEHVVKVAS
jgi:hypothetical protein